LNTNTLGVFDTRTKKLYEMNTPSLYTSDILGLEGMDFVDYSLGHIVLSSQLSANKISTSSDLPNTATFGAVIKHSHYEKEFQDFERMFANNPVFATYKLNK
ncbi:MAG: hypothetical protein QG607_237, partial [Patescibacteria group bacterium]|nr:hypothetical protein [Patescibacteria group bacterium]